MGKRRRRMSNSAVTELQSRSPKSGSLRRETKYFRIVSLLYISHDSIITVMELQLPSIPLRAMSPRLDTSRMPALVTCMCVSRDTGHIVSAGDSSREMFPMRRRDIYTHISIHTYPSCQVEYVESMCLRCTFIFGRYVLTRDIPTRSDFTT